MWGDNCHPQRQRTPCPSLFPPTSEPGSCLGTETPSVSQGAAPPRCAQAAGQLREPGCAHGASGPEASAAQLVPAGPLWFGHMPWQCQDADRKEDSGSLAGSLVLWVASGPWCTSRFTENNLFNIKNNFLWRFGWRQPSAYSPGNSNKGRAGAQPGGRVLGGRVHPGLGPASGSLTGLWHDVSIYLLDMFEQEMLMVWVCGDSWRGPAGAAGKGRVRRDGAAQRAWGNRSWRCCWWRSVPSVLEVEVPAGDEAGEGPDGSAVSSSATDCSRAASAGLLPARCRARCLRPMPPGCSGTALLKRCRGNGDHRALHAPSPTLGLGPGWCPLAWEGCGRAASPCEGVERFLRSPALDRAVPAFADNSGGEA